MRVLKGRILGRVGLRSCVAFLTSLLPAIVMSEGAVKQLDCRVIRVCDAAGECASNAGDIAFTMEPLELGAAGAGSYTVRYALGTAEAQAEMQAGSDAGPFLWNVGQERHALIASSETQWLWHQLAFSPGPEATIRFLECRFQQ